MYKEQINKYRIFLDIITNLLISEVTYCLSVLYLLRLNFNLVSLNLGQSDLGVLYCNLDSVVQANRVYLCTQLCRGYCVWSVLVPRDSQPPSLLSERTAFFHIFHPRAIVAYHSINLHAQIMYPIQTRKSLHSILIQKVQKSFLSN